MRLHKFLLVFLTTFCVQTHAALPTASGDLKSYLETITFGSENDAVFKIPGTKQLADFEDVVSKILGARYDEANELAQTLDYELLAYSDTVSGELFYVLREQNPLPSALANGGGIYVFNPEAAYNAAIHAPHPRSDTNTNRSAITAFFSTDVRYFMMAGSHRRSHPDPSTCQDFSDYRPSDAVHNTKHYFYMAHKAMEDFDATIHYIELHGYGSDSLEVIASQCDTGGNPAVVNVSETLSDNDAEASSFMHTFESIINQDGQFSVCIYSTILDTGPDDKYSAYLGGGTNTPSRYTNGSPSVCDQSARVEDNSRRYIHIEQSWGIRQREGNRQLMAGYIDQAVRGFLVDQNENPFVINAGLNDAWFNPETDGQGFFVSVFPDLGAVALSWFTYDTSLPPDDAISYLGDAGHRWLNAIGPIDGRQSVMEVSMSSGGLFDTASEVTEVVDGTIILTFDDCNTATVEYDIISAGLKGTVPIRRVAADNIALCEALSAQ